jgi:hypothetical protein
MSPRTPESHPVDPPGKPPQADEYNTTCPDLRIALSEVKTEPTGLSTALSLMHASVLVTYSCLELIVPNNQNSLDAVFINADIGIWTDFLFLSFQDQGTCSVVGSAMYCYNHYYFYYYYQYDHYSPVILVYL